MAGVKRQRRRQRRDFQSLKRQTDEMCSVEYAALRAALNSLGLIARLWQAVRLAFGRF